MLVWETIKRGREAFLYQLYSLSLILGSLLHPRLNFQMPEMLFYIIFTVNFKRCLLSTRLFVVHIKYHVVVE